MAVLLPKDIALKYFTLSNEQTFEYKCGCRTVIIQRKNSGWSNLSHIKSRHPEYSKLSNQPQLTFNIDSQAIISKKGCNI